MGSNQKQSKINKKTKKNKCERNKISLSEVIKMHNRKNAVTFKKELWEIEGWHIKNEKKKHSVCKNRPEKKYPSIKRQLWFKRFTSIHQILFQ